MRYLVVFATILLLINCGGSGSGSSADLSCAPSSPSTPTVDLNTAELGQWTLTLTQTTSTCAYAPDAIVCLLDMVVTDNDVAISGTCATDDEVVVTLSGVSGKVSGDTLYWGATMSETVDSYTETDTVSCTSVDFESDILSETFSVTASVAWSNSDSGESGTCSSTFSAYFH